MQMDEFELRAWLRLLLTPSIGNESARRLLTRFGSVLGVFEATALELTEVVSRAQAEALLQPPVLLDAQTIRTLQWLSTHPKTLHAQRAIWHIGHPDYPEPLLHLADPPLLLYVEGQVDQSLGPAVSVVGSRNPTPQGRQTAMQFGRALAEAGICVVSGMALGVDGASHLGALQFAKPQGARSSAVDSSRSGASSSFWTTVGVVGTGLDQVYPRHHQELAAEVIAHGVLISEYPLGTPPLAANFPQRNRLIAALGLGTLVVEAAMRSGSLITARMALDMGREVMAVPGSIHAMQSHGCHWLIRQGAKLVANVKDILEELQIHISTDGGNNPDVMGLQPTSQPHPVLKQMGFTPISLDALQIHCKLEIAELQSVLLGLELEGHVARLPGGLFQRLGPRS
jgi:DNA processing protein